jgi:tetratricopeptide (TPR) repeat protein
MTRWTTLAAAAALLAAVPMTGCKTYTSGLKTGSTTASQTAAASYDEAKAIWTAERGTKEGLQKAITMLETVVTTEPDNQDAWILLARSYYFMADAYTESNEDKGPLFEMGVTAGEKAMAADDAFRAQIEKGVKPDNAVASLQKDDQMAIYWTASSLGKWARIQGFSTIVKYKGYIGKMMTHCLALDEAAYYGGPVRYWGAFYSVAPGFAGGDMDKSKEMYEKAIQMFPENFASYVLYADTYATKAQDRELFKKNLEIVINGDPNSLPEMLPEQINEQRKAKDLLARIDELFAS